MDKLLREKQAGTFWGPWSQDLERNSFAALEKAACASTCFGGSLLAGCEPAAEEAALQHSQAAGGVPAVLRDTEGSLVIPAEATKRQRRGAQHNLSARLKTWAKDGPKFEGVFKHIGMQMDTSWGFTNINRNFVELQKYQSDSPNIWMLLERWSLGPVWPEVRYAGLVTTEYTGQILVNAAVLQDIRALLWTAGVLVAHSPQHQPVPFS